MLSACSHHVTRADNNKFVKNCNDHAEIGGVNSALVQHMYTADPSVHVFNDKLYIYPSHDLEKNTVPNNDGNEYDMEDYHVFSMESITEKVVDHGQILHLNDVPWAKKQMWAPDAAFKNGQYYFYFPSRDETGIFRIGVATSENPTGPFAANSQPIRGSYSIDPAVYVEKNEAYMFFGGLWGGQLEKWQDGEFNLNSLEPDDNLPALGPKFAKLSENMHEFDGSIKEIQILDQAGAPILAGDHDRRFFEGAWVHKFANQYYLSYSTGNTHKIVYATSPKLEGPYTYQGVILEPVIGWTTHHSIVEFKSKWYLFYHDASLSCGINHKRSIKVKELTYDDSNYILTISP